MAHCFIWMFNKQLNVLLAILQLRARHIPPDLTSLSRQFYVKTRAQRLMKETNELDLIRSVGYSIILSLSVSNFVYAAYFHENIGLDSVCILICGNVIRLTLRSARLIE